MNKKAPGYFKTLMEDYVNYIRKNISISMDEFKERRNEKIKQNENIKTDNKRRDEQK